MKGAWLTVAIVLGVGACSANHALDTSPLVSGPVGARDAAPAGDAPSMSGDDAAAAGLACAATCGTPARPVADVSGVAAYESMTGRWQICSGRDLWAMLGAPSDTVGIEYTADQHMYYLVDGPNGPTRGAGFAYQLTYEVLDGGQLDMHPVPNATFFGSLSYSPCPREIQIAPFAYNEAGSNLVPLPDAAPPATTQPAPSCVATCETPAGDITMLSTIGDVYSAFEGRWLFCGGSSGWQSVGAPSDAVGVEFGPALGATTPTAVGGYMYYLVEESGTLARGTGPAYQLSYSLTSKGSYQVLQAKTASNEVISANFRYSPCPRELQLDGIGEPSTVIVPAP